MTIKNYDNLNDMQLDALREIGSIGSGYAAASLSSMMDKKIQMDVPSVDIMGYEEIMNLIGGPEIIASAVLVELKKDMNGMVLFIQQEDFVAYLLEAFTMKKIDNFFELDEMDVSAVIEIGNIMISSYVNAIGQMTGLDIELTVPSHTVNMSGAILSVPIVMFAEESDKLLMIKGDFIIDGKKFASDLLLIPDLDSLNKMLDNLGVNSD